MPSPLGHRCLKRSVSLILLGAPLLLGGCVWKSDYEALQGRNDALASQNQQLEGQNQQLHADVARLQNAIKFTVNSDLLFAPGSWKMSSDGEDVVAKMASQLAPTQSRHLVVNGYTDNAPIGPGLKKAGVTSNEILSQKRAEAVMAFLVSRGVKAELISAKGWGEAQPV